MNTEESIMLLEKINYDFSICKVSQIDTNILNGEFTFISKTDRELSIICRTELVPHDYITLENDWNGFRIAEDAAFGKFGMIAFLTQIIAKEKTGVLVIATYDTDYLFIKKEKFLSVCESLIQQGCQFI